MDCIQHKSTVIGKDDGHMGLLLPVCSICNQVPKQGIRGVIRVGRAWICRDCEQKIMLLEVGSPDYGIMVEKMRSVLEIDNN